MKEIVLIGGGGHCESCIDVIEQEGTYEIVGIVDKKELIGKKVLNYEVFATDEDLPLLAKKYRYVLITIGQIGSPEIRRKIYNLVKGLGFELPVVKSPLAYVSKYAEIGEGTIIMHGAIVNAGARIGKNCIINSKALIEHGAVIGDFSHISTGVIINGGVVVGQDCFLGSNSTTKQYTKIPNGSFIKAGSVVV